MLPPDTSQKLLGHHPRALVGSSLAAFCPTPAGRGRRTRRYGPDYPEVINTTWRGSGLSASAPSEPAASASPCPRAPAGDSKVQRTLIPAASYRGALSSRRGFPNIPRWRRTRACVRLWRPPPMNSTGSRALSPLPSSPRGGCRRGPRRSGPALCSISDQHRPWVSADFPGSRFPVSKRRVAVTTA